MASPISAANAYAKLARLADPGANLAKAGGGNSAGPSFGQMVKDAIGIRGRGRQEVRRHSRKAWPPARRTSWTW